MVIVLLTLLVALASTVSSRNLRVRSTDLPIRFGLFPMEGEESQRHSNTSGRSTSTNFKWSSTVTWGNVAQQCPLTYISMDETPLVTFTHLLPPPIGPQRGTLFLVISRRGRGMRVLH